MTKAIVEAADIELVDQLCERSSEEGFGLQLGASGSHGRLNG